MIHSRTLSAFAALLAVGSGTALLAQVQTGSLVTIVKDAAGRPLANAKVTLQSPALMGQRTGVTDTNGMFRAPLLPPGDYTGTVNAVGFVPAKLTAGVTLGGSTTLEAVLRPQQEAAAVVVVVGTQAKLDKQSVTQAETLSQEEVLKLPVSRTLTGITFQAPGVVAGAGGRPVIQGAEGFENKYLVNGVDVNDNLFNTPNNLFIEDAIDETQVLLNNVTAEYGRFTGGVINSITKSGGNALSGSLRVTVTNSAWNAVKPFQDRTAIVSKVNPIYTATIGGPILKDKLWYFVALRSEKTSESSSLPRTSAPYTATEDEKRAEVNLKWALNSDHFIAAAYNFRKRDGENLVPLLGATSDPNSLYARNDSNNLVSLRYQGLFGPSITAEVLATKKTQKILSTGGTGTAFANSPVRGWNIGSVLFNNRYFGVDPEYRNNMSFSPKVTFFFEALGSHELKVGAEYFEESREANNQQSPTGFVLFTRVNIDPANTRSWVYDFRNSTNGAESIAVEWQAPGGKLTSKYTSLYINDNWTISNRWNASLGLRYEGFKGSLDESGAQIASWGDVVPRLGVNWDLKGDGKTQLSASLAVYAGKAYQNRVGAATTVGVPRAYLYDYIGGNYVTPANTNSGAGFTRAGYSTTPYSISDPLVNVRVDPDVKSPRTTEQTLGVKRAFGTRGFWTLTYVNREYTRQFEDFQGEHGQVTFNGRPFYITYWTNAPDKAQRTYDSLQFTLSDQLGKFSYRGNYTFSKLRGNYDSEGGNVVGGGTVIGDYERARPNSGADLRGPLGNDTPNNLKLFGTYVETFGENSLTLAMAYEYLSGAPYSHTLPSRPSTTGIYSPQPGSYTVFFSERGQYRLPDYYTLDFSAQWDGKFGKGLGYFAKFTAFSVLNNIQKFNYRRDGVASSTGTWTPGASYGKATAATDFTGNRRLQVDLGFRF